MQLAAVYCVSRISGYCTCCYAGNLTVCSNSYFAQLSAFSGDLAVVAVCIANEQLAVTQCAVLVEYAVFQYYVADYAFICSYLAKFSFGSNQFAVFVYNQFAICCIECAVAVYEERYGAVFICSTYGQVIFCVQCVGLNGVYTGNVAFFIDSYLTKFSGFRSDLAVVAVCIAYIQLTVTQCGIFIEYAIFQYYVADFAFGCGYFAVFIYNQFAVGSIKCTVAVYKERYSAVFICSTYGQVVFCVQSIGLNGVSLNRVYINVFVQLNLYIFAIIAYADVLVAAKVNSFAGCYFRCCIAVCGKGPALVCVICYFADFLQLLFSCSLTFAVSKSIISSSLIAKSAYSCTSAIHNYISCCYTAACPDSSFAATDVHKCVIITGKENIVIQSNFVFLATVCIEVFGYSNISTIGNSSMLACFSSYFLQLLFGCSFTFAVSKFIISSSFIAKPAYSCSSTIHDNTAIYSAAYCYTASCPDSAFATADAYKSVRIISCKINIVFQVNIIFFATVRIIFLGYSNVVTCGNSTVFECFCWRISSHRRSHACTGHNTCCNQHCQQLFGRAAFTAMIFCNFGDNNICVARLTPNYFEYFVHQKFLPHK